jgi:uncharacterized protein (DUF2126 family)
VLGLRYGIGTVAEHTTADIARQLGLSRERVRQIQRDALKHLRKQAQMLEALLDADARHAPTRSPLPEPDPCQRRRQAPTRGLAAPAGFAHGSAERIQNEGTEHEHHHLA